MILEKTNIAIIGAGITAAALTRALQVTDMKIEIFEKSRGAGGRMATRRLMDGTTADHGAQYFTSQSQTFDRFINKMVQQNRMAKWQVREDKQCFIGTPHMNSPIKSVFEAVNLTSNAHVSAVARRGNRWWLIVNGEEKGPYDYVVSTVPAPQAQVIAADAVPALLQKLDIVKIAPCWALMLVFKSPVAQGLNT